MQYATRKDIQDLLELLNTTNDTEIPTKIFSLLACYLVSGKSTTHSDLIITSHFVYDKIYAVLNNGLPMKITVTLNFVSALVLEVEDDAYTTRQSLVLHARNMLRVSGCLALMSNLFNSCMVHQETWTALCRCLSEVCRNSKENQNYCSNLIATGIRRCRTGDLESYQVLQSLLYKHDQNIQHFIENDGLTMITRDKLHNTSCLKLVNAIAENPKGVILLVHQTEVIEILRNYLDLYGKESLIGKWATIIVYNIKTFVKDLYKHKIKSIQNVANRFREDDKNENNIKEFPKDMKGGPKEIATNIDYRFCLPNDKRINNNHDDDDTTELFQNIFREILRSQKEDMEGVRSNVGVKPKYDNIIDQEMLSPNIRSTFPLKMQTINNSKVLSNRPIVTPNTIKCISRKDSCDDLSFSFLLNDNMNRNRNTSYRNQHRVSKLSSNLTEKEKSIVFTTTSTVDIKHEIQDNNNVIMRSFYNITELVENMEHCKQEQTLEFKPTIVSTPKRRIHKQFRDNSIKNKKKENTNSRYTFKHQKQVKNKSFSGKFFSAINESCTMLMKTVKNIFTTKNMNDNNNETKQEKNSIVNAFKKTHSNYSFMDYMRRRDAIMGSQCGDLSNDKKSGTSCETCNDTVLLKRKLEKDHQLKQTLKKLKFGINLYGCDFKKISSTMWPRDSYMTPTVLYNLYRKLLAK